MKKKSWNRIFIEFLSEKPIAFLPSLAHVSESANAGLLLSQLLYWWGKGHVHGWIYKTIEEVQRETCLTRSEQNTAFKKWERLGVLEKKLKGIPPKRHFRINTEKLTELLRVVKQSDDIGKLNNQNQQYITESTPETTSKNSSFRTCTLQRKENPPESERVKEIKKAIRKQLGMNDL